MTYVFLTGYIDQLNFVLLSVNYVILYNTIYKP